MSASSPQMPAMPLTEVHAPEDVMVLHHGRSITRAEFMAEVEALAAQLPEAAQAFNCCEDRYHFMVAFAAILLRGQTNLLPPSRAPEMIRDIAGDYPGAYYLTDEDSDIDAVPVMRFAIQGDGARSAGNPQIDPVQVAAIAFTSGSTGRPRPNAKTWAALHIGTDMAARRFFVGLQRPFYVLGTVPPQHMYGLETTILHALLSGGVMHSGRPLFAEDIRQALSALPRPRVLITTPVHLRACVKSGLDFPPSEFMISATAPLPLELADAAEAAFHAPVLEIYGCTEAGSLASRRTLDGDTWTLYPEMRLHMAEELPLVSGPQLAEPVPLQDLVEPQGEHAFVLRGRSSDMVNIAGKRASLADLNIKLLAIEGVEDGVIVMPDEHEGVTRLAALVVAPGLNEGEVQKRLRASFDPVFLPRPMYMVDRLPRNETSKLPRSAVLDMLRQLHDARRLPKDIETDR